MASTVNSEQETEAEASLRSNLEAQRNKLQVIVQSEFGLLSKLLSSKVLTVTDQEIIKSVNTTIGRNQKLLETIFERGKYNEFIDALGESGQTHVVNWINGNGDYRPEFGLDWPLTEREIEILDSNYDKLGEILSVKEELIRILFTDSVINVRQKDFISSKLTTCEANEAFLGILRQSSLKAYFLTVKYLRKLNEVRSANLLDNVTIDVPVHVNLGGENVDEVETQLVKKWTQLFLEDTALCDAADLDNLLAWLRVSITSVKKGSSIVLFVSCCTIDEYRRLCTLVDNNDIIKKVIEKLFNQLVQNFLSKVLLVRINESDREKAENLFQRELLRDKKYDDHFQQLYSQLKYEEPLDLRTEESIEESKEEEFPQESEDPSTSASVEDEKQEDMKRQLAESRLKRKAEKYAFQNARMGWEREKVFYEKSRMKWEKEKEARIRSLQKGKKELTQPLSDSGKDEMDDLENNLHKTREFLEEFIDTDFDLIDRLRAQGVLKIREIDDIKAEHSHMRRSSLLLDIISTKKKIPELCDALIETGQAHIVNFLKACGERSPKFGDDWPLTEREISILDINHESLVDILETCCDLIGRLYSNGAINRRQLDFISSKSTDYEKNEALLEILRRGSLRSYKQTIECLCESKQNHIAEILDTGKGIQVPVHATLKTDNLDEAETQIVEEMTKLLTQKNVSSGRLISALQLNITAVKRGQ